MGSNLIRWMVVVVLIIVLLFTIQRFGISFTWLPETLQDFFCLITTPLQKAVNFVHDTITGSIEGWQKWSTLKEENRRLKYEIFKLKRELVTKEIISKENLRLRRLLGFVEENPSFSYLGARVIGKASGNWFSRLIIDRGRDDGIKTGMPVITYEGALVGEVGEVFKSSAQVITVFDPVFVVGGIVERSDSRTVGIIKSGENYLLDPFLLMENIPWDGDVKKGDIVVTSGLAKGFPKGLPVGRVVEIKQKDYGLTQSATLEAFLKHKTVEEVLVITSF